MDEEVASVAPPTALAFTPDGRMLVAGKFGELRVYTDGALLPAPALDLGARLCTEEERGLLGVAVDPAFSETGWIYLYYTHADADEDACENRVSRFTLAAGTVDPASELVLLDAIPSPDPGAHNGGDLRFDRDGLLYVTVGDGGCDLVEPHPCGPGNGNARRLDVLLGKVLRIRRDGGIPPGNPFQGAGTARCHEGGAPPETACQEIFSFGLRNPFRIAFDGDAGTTRFFVNDVGQEAAEEINLGQAGADYGWNVCEAVWLPNSDVLCEPPAGAVAPLHSYRHDEEGCSAITGAAFVPSGAWAPDYDGDYLYADFMCGKVFRLENDATDPRQFAGGLGRVVAVGFHPGERALYYARFGSPELKRIVAIPASAAPPRTAGRPLAGGVLHADDGAWRGSAAAAYDHRWRRCDRSGTRCGPIRGGNGRSYRVGHADVGRRLRVAVTARNAAGQTTALSTATRVVGPAVRLGRIRYAARRLNGEWVELRNVLPRPVSLRGWVLRSRSRAVYRFGARPIPAGGTIRVHTGRGRATARHRYWGRARPVWDDTRGRASLRTPAGTVADACGYRGRPRGIAAC